MGWTPCNSAKITRQFDEPRRFRVEVWDDQTGLEVKEFPSETFEHAVLDQALAWMREKLTERCM